MPTILSKNSIIGKRAPIFWASATAICAGVMLHLPMLVEAHRMGNHLSGMSAFRFK